MRRKRAVAAFSIKRTATDRLEAEGAICFSGAAQALKSGLALIGPNENTTIDLAQVTETDSAGLAVLVEWLAHARKLGTVLHYANIPAQILAVARISDLDALLTDGY
jgi:phospholipid transport system transporter-binding protein